MSECPVCSHELEASKPGAEKARWVLVGYIADKMSADYAKEVLMSYEIPVVVISKSGFFGQAGLTFHSFYKSESHLFEVSVPANCVEEAIGVLDMVLGDKWQKKE
jgi:hypothetical protein